MRDKTELVSTRLGRCEKELFCLNARGLGKALRIFYIWMPEGGLLEWGCKVLARLAAASFDGHNKIRQRLSLADDRML